MKYMGSKARFADKILPIILAGRHEAQAYVEPFCGGCNSIDRVTGPRIASDNNPYLIAMWTAIVKGWVPPTVNRELYNEIRSNKEKFGPHVVGWAGFNCSYSGKWFGGFAGATKTKIDTVRDYQAEALRNVLRQAKRLEGVQFVCSEYYDLDIPEGAVVYCDPPYAETTKYRLSFDHTRFWEWVRITSRTHPVYVSEYCAPDDFECVWQGKASSSLSANGKVGGNKVSTERLFRMRQCV